MKLVSLDHDQGSGVDRIISLIISFINIIIDHHHRPVVVAQRAPANIVSVIIPADPGWPPVNRRDPVPAEAQPPVPSSVMINSPAPGFS